MHPLHTYIASQLADRVQSHRVVVWYDKRHEFTAFVDELRGGPRTSRSPVLVSLASPTQLVQYAGSMFELRDAVEPHFRGDVPDPLVLYLPGCEHDPTASVLKELEVAGMTWAPELRLLAKEVLLQKYTLGTVDEMLPAERKVTYQDLARAASATDAAPPSILRSIFHDALDHDVLLATWISSDSRDPEIQSKDAICELSKLVKARLGRDLPDGAALAKLRAVTARHVLGSEFRLDLTCPPPASLAALSPLADHAADGVRAVARLMRTMFPDVYETLADRVQDDLELASAELPASGLGTVDTFRFEERALLRHAGELVAEQRFADALVLVSQRTHSFWLDRDVGRKAQWEACRRMAELGTTAAEVLAAVRKAPSSVAAWFAAYTATDGWHRLDLAQRRLETTIASLDEHPDERPLAIVRRLYEDTAGAMADGFTRELVHAGWNIPGALHQTRIFGEIVSDRPKPVAYFFVDAMRFEMGVELAARLPKTSEVAVRAAVGALPSITPIGMAALLPGAAASFSIAHRAAKFGAQIDGSFLSEATDRKKHAASRIPAFVDILLDELLSLQPSKLAKKIEGAQVIIVRSTEIDAAGEKGNTHQARQVMDTVIDNLVRAIRRLAVAGVEYAVVSADHGHLFYPTDRDESMRTEAPGGETIDLHRRCWIGRGGATPPATVRVSAAQLGYASDLELVFPTGLGVLKAGGDLAFHHGGASLQEMVIPVLSIRTPSAPAAKAQAQAIQLANVPTEITNRMITCQVSSLLGAVICPLMISAGRKVGSLFGAVGDAEVDKLAGTVRIPPGGTVTIVLLLQDDRVTKLSIAIQDPTTDAPLVRPTADLPVRLLGV